MLRTPLNRPTPAEGQADGQAQSCWRASSGTAAVLGLRALRMDVAPTTAYLMLGDRCSRDCAFCTQARGSHTGEDMLSRVTWPELPAEEIVEAIGAAWEAGAIERACFQVTVSPCYLEKTAAAIARLRQGGTIPICASVLPHTPDDVARLLEAGAERVTIALDAASEAVYRRVKGGSWERTLGLLTQCARLFPGRIGTHLIAGLGETEREMVELMAELVGLQVSVGLFAFTPIAGTALATAMPPSPAHYRRLQVARWLLVRRLGDVGAYAYDAQGRLTSYGLGAAQLRAVIACGDAFRTSGCPGCNRPYYNERPGGPLYNYPRALSPAETRREMDALLASLDTGPQTEVR